MTAKQKATKKKHKPQQVTHSFLQQSGVWQSSGIYEDARCGEVDFSGETTVQLGTSLVLHSWIRLIMEGEPLFQNRYEAGLPDAGARVIPWRSVNPQLGELVGRFLLADGLILSYFASTDGELMGHEALVEDGPNQYRLAGFCFENGSPLSRWQGKLTLHK